MSSQRTSSAVAERFTIGRVLALSWHAWIACRWQVLLIVAPVAALRAIGGPYLYAALPKSLGSGWRELITGSIGAGITAPAIACLAYAVVRFAGGENVRPIDILRTPWRRIPVVVIAALIVWSMMEGPELLIPDPRFSAVAIIATFLALTVYRVAVMAVTFLFLPILAVERTSVAGALDRGISLMSGHRWRVVALALLLWLMLSLVGLVHLAWIRPWYPALGEEIFFLLRFVRTFLTISITACISAAAYYLLRSEKQGASPEVVARVFE